jgi:hypothetical protein
MRYVAVGACIVHFPIHRCRSCSTRGVWWSCGRRPTATWCRCSWTAQPALPSHLPRSRSSQAGPLPSLRVPATASPCLPATAGACRCGGGTCRLGRPCQASGPCLTSHGQCLPSPPTTEPPWLSWLEGSPRTKRLEVRSAGCLAGFENECAPVRFSGELTNTAMGISLACTMWCFHGLNYAIACACLCDTSMLAFMCIHRPLYVVCRYL